MTTFNTREEYEQDVYGTASQRVEARVKPVVQYSKAYTSIVVGQSVTLRPVDHPATYLNGGIAHTSTVVSVELDGSFETRNTKYVPYKGV